MLNTILLFQEAGYSHAIRIVRQMKRRNVQLTVHVFNLLLRCTRECGVGSEEHLRHLFQEWSADSVRDRETNQRMMVDSERVSKLSIAANSRPGKKDEDISNDNEDSATNNLDKPSAVAIVLPNLLKPLASLTKESIVGFDMTCLSDPVNRLYLIGGLEGVIQMLKEARVKPSPATVTLLLDSLPGTEVAELSLIKSMEELGAKLDTDFYNMLIKKRNFRHDFKSALAAFKLMQADNLYLDIVTFRVLAIGYWNAGLGLRLISDMEQAGFKPNTAILGAMVRAACYAKDYKYLLELLRVIEYRQIPVEPNIIESIVLCNKRTQETLLKIERKQLDGSTWPPYQREGFEDSYDQFKLYFKGWLKRTKIHIPEAFDKQFQFQQTPRPKEKFDNFEAEMKERINKRFEREHISQQSKY